MTQLKESDELWTKLNDARKELARAIAKKNRMKKQQCWIYGSRCEVIKKKRVVDTDHCGGWTQIFGGNASEQGDFWTSCKTQLSPMLLHLTPLLGVIPSEFHR